MRALKSFVDARSMRLPLATSLRLRSTALESFDHAVWSIR